MKIRNIYFSKGLCVVSLTIAILCIVTTIISQVIPSAYMIFAFTYPVNYPWQLITYVFLHGYPKDLLPADFNYSAMAMAVGHVTFNLLLVIPFGVLVEKVIGSKRFLIFSVVTWLLDLFFVFFMALVLTPKGEQTIAAGASGLAFAYMPIGMYIIFFLGKTYGFKQLLKQVSFYLLLPIAITTLVFALSPSIKGVAGIGSMILHLAGITIGVIFAIIYNKRIKEYFN